MIRLKKAKKLFWLKKKKNYEEKRKTTHKMIQDLLISTDDPENTEMTKDVLGLLAQQTKEHEFSEIPDYFLCKINYVSKITHKFLNLKKYNRNP